MDERTGQNGDMLTLESTAGLTPLTQGNTAEIYAYEGNTILKLLRDRYPKSDAEREYRANCLIRQQYLMLPRALCMVDCGGRYGILYERAEGRDMTAVIGEQPRLLFQMAKRLAHIHQEIHAIRTDQLVPVKEKLAAEIRRAGALTDDEKSRVLRLLSPLPEGSALCHFDFHPGNIMMTDTSYRVIDWLTACAGDPAADIARTWLLLKYGTLKTDSLPDRVRLLLARACLRRTYLRESLRLSGVTGEAVRKWLVPIAAARLSEGMSEEENKRMLKLVRRGLRR